MSTTVMYKGPELHERIISKEDLVKALELPEDKFPEGFERFYWAAGPGRRSQSLEGHPQQVIDLFTQDPSMEIKEDGDVTSEAAPDADHVAADGSSPGVDGNAELAEAIGFSEASDRTSGTSSVGGSTDGDSTSTSTSGSTGVGGSTAGI